MPRVLANRSRAVRRRRVLIRANVSHTGIARRAEGHIGIVNTAPVKPLRSGSLTDKRLDPRPTCLQRHRARAQTHVATTRRRVHSANCLPIPLIRRAGIALSPIEHARLTCLTRTLIDVRHALRTRLIKPGIALTAARNLGAICRALWRDITHPSRSIERSTHTDSRNVIYVNHRAGGSLAHAFTRLPRSQNHRLERICRMP